MPIRYRGVRRNGHAKLPNHTTGKLALHRATWEEITVRTTALLVCSAALGLAAAALVTTGATAVAAQPAAAPPDRAQDPAAGMGEMLIRGLRSTEGCLGVDAGQMMSGKRSIFAWFEDKQAALRWYHSPTHQGIMRAALGDDLEQAGEPLEHVGDDDGPMLVIASITMADRPAIEGMNLPMSQISIELYQPLPGGAHINGRLAPEGFEVEHMQDYTPAADEPR